MRCTRRVVNSDVPLDCMELSHNSMRPDGLESVVHNLVLTSDRGRVYRIGVNRKNILGNVIPPVD
jgi:hypothetical protein